MVDIFDKLNYINDRTYSSNMKWANDFFKILGWAVDETEGDFYQYKLNKNRILLYYKENPLIYCAIEQDIFNIKKIYQELLYAWNYKAYLLLVTDKRKLGLYKSTEKIEKENNVIEQDILSDRINLEEFYRYSDQLLLLKSDHVERKTIKKFIDNEKMKPVEKQFFLDYKRWRDLILNSLKENKEELNKILNYTQRILDKIILIRFCEDRQIVNYKKLKEVLEKGIYCILRDILKYYNETLDSEVFSLTNDDFDIYDINETIFQVIIKELYYYKFDALPLELIGKIYESFLEYDIFDERESSDLKQRKGIYYTPTYIVDYLVSRSFYYYKEYNENIKDIKILDSSCGSGTFLIKYFNLLTDKNLSFAEKKRIILNNLRGIDIDNKALEITALSLIFSLLEGAKKLEGNKLLPEFSGHVLFQKDSFVDTNFLNSIPKFDIIVGNPPYGLNISDENKFNLEENNYISVHDKAKSEWILLEKSIKNLKKNGVIAMILPSSLLKLDSLTKLRRFLFDSLLIKEVIELNYEVFDKTSINTMLFIAIKSSNQKAIEENIIKLGRINKYQQKINIPKNEIAQGQLGGNNYRINVMFNNYNKIIIENIDSQSTKFKNYFKVKSGIKIRKNLLVKNKKDKNHKKIIFGKNVNKYYVSWDGYYINYTREEEKKFANQALREQEIFEKEKKLLIRQILGDTIYCALDNQKMYVQQTAYISYVKENIDCKDNYTYFALGIMNSILAAFYLKYKYAKDFTLFPKITGGEIEKMPLHKYLNSGNKTVNDIIEISKKIYEKKTETDEFLQIDYFKNLEELEYELNKKIFDLYNLTPKEREQIIEFYKEG